MLLMPATIARRMRLALEPIHALVYFAPSTLDELKAAGFKGGWMGYFATRAAPMGPVPAEVVIATFFNFAPGMVRRSIPDAWSFSTPEAANAARFRAADLAMRGVLGDGVGSPDVAEAADLVRRATEGCRPHGRPLFAGHVALPWPDEPHVALWHGATLIREHRGDGHVSALTAAGLDGLEAHLLAAAAGATSKEVILPFRGWTEEEWAAAADRLRDRGLLDGDEQLTDAGRALRDDIEATTDELAADPWRLLGDEGCSRLEELLQPVVDRILATGGLPYPNPMGLTRP